MFVLIDALKPHNCANSLVYGLVGSNAWGAITIYRREKREFHLHWQATVRYVLVLFTNIQSYSQLLMCQQSSNKIQFVILKLLRWDNQLSEIYLLFINSIAWVTQFRLICFITCWLVFSTALETIVRYIRSIFDHILSHQRIYYLEIIL